MWGWMVAMKHVVDQRSEKEGGGGELPELELEHEWQQWHGGKVRQTAPHCCHQQAWLWEVLFVLDVASRLFIWEGTAELRNEKV